MKNTILMTIGAALVLAAAGEVRAQNVAQTLNVNLTAYSPGSGTTANRIKINSKNLITFLGGGGSTNGSSSRSQQLQLVHVTGGGADTNGNIGAFLRVVNGSGKNNNNSTNGNNNIVFEVPTPDNFNLFQDLATTDSRGNRTITFATDRFSLAFGTIAWELQGFTTWTSASASDPFGSFHSTVNGFVSIDGVTQGSVPVSGTITGSAPKSAP